MFSICVIHSSNTCVGEHDSLRVHALPSFCGVSVLNVNKPNSTIQTFTRATQIILGQELLLLLQLSEAISEQSLRNVADFQGTTWHYTQDFLFKMLLQIYLFLV
jgi:hypothetical protein